MSFMCVCVTSRLFKNDLIYARHYADVLSMWQMEKAVANFRVRRHTNTTFDEVPSSVQRQHEQN